MTTTTPRHSQWATPYLGRPLRDQLIAEGLIVPREERLTHIRHGHPVLRLDDAGRASAQQHMRDPRILRTIPSFGEVMARQPGFGRKPR